MEAAIPVSLRIDTARPVQRENYWLEVSMIKSLKMGSLEIITVLVLKFIR